MRERVLELAEKKKIGTIAALGRAAGLTRHTVRAALAGTKRPTDETIGKLAEALGAPVSVVALMLGGER